MTVTSRCDQCGKELSVAEPGIYRCRDCFTKQQRQRFKRGPGVYVCSNCGKRTRATGDGEESCELCARCYRNAGIENGHEDEGHDGDVEGCPLCLAAGWEAGE